MTSLLRANLHNIQSNVDLSEKTTRTVEEAEDLVSQIFNETISAASDPFSIYSLVATQLHGLRNLAQSAATDLRPEVLNALRTSGSAHAVLSSTYDQVLSVLDAHNVDNNVHIVNFSTELIKLGNAVNVAKNCFAPNTR